jgi:hypothetical protein
MYPAAQIKKEMREVAVHEWVHLLDLNQWKVNPIKVDRPDVKKLEEEFDRVFPTLVQLERHGRKYQAEFEEFRNGGRSMMSETTTPAGFVVDSDGSPILLVTRYSTPDQVAHELEHFIFWKNLKELASS